MDTGVFYAVVAGVFWGTSSVLVKRGLLHSNDSSATLIQQTASLTTLVVAALLEGDLVPKNISPWALLVFSATGIVGAYLGRTLFVKSIAEIGAARAQSLNNSAPLITVFLAALVLGERLSVYVIAGVVLIVSGIFFVTDPETNVDGSARRTVTVTSALATLCYGIVPVLKKIGTDFGG